MIIKTNTILKQLDDNKGRILVYEPLSNDFNRVYFLYGAKKDTIRGEHAHKKLKQLFICIHGSIEITLFDGKTHENIILNSPENRIEVGAMIWRTIKWLEDDSVLFVLASQQYDEADYIRDFDEFLRLVKK
jgi:dTDP-4-dehydrorhamnose 3,5-epimerase-like enzyme